MITLDNTINNMNTLDPDDMSFLRTKLQDMSNMSTYITFDRNKLFYHPRANYITPGVYFSKIVKAYVSETDDGKPAVDICYLMIDAHVMRRILKGEELPGDAEEYYPIKERFIRGSDKLDHFTSYILDSLSMNDGFDLKQIIGFTELLSLRYANPYDIGIIYDRAYCTETQLKNL